MPISGSLACPRCRRIMNWLKTPDVEVVNDSIICEGEVLSCPHCECASIMSVVERKCGRCGVVESQHQLRDNLNHFFERIMSEMEIPNAKDCNQMLRVTLPTGQILGLQFRHRFTKAIVDGAEVKGRMSHCGIYDLTDLKPTDKPIKISMGLARCSEKDQFNRETGRKISLTRALLGGDHFLSEKTESAKGLREVIWDAYHNRFLKPDFNGGTPAIDGEVIGEIKQLPATFETLDVEKASIN